MVNKYIDVYFFSGIIKMMDTYQVKKLKFTSEASDKGKTHYRHTL